MKTRSRFIVLCLLVAGAGSFFSGHAQTVNKYGLKVISDYQEYLKSIVADNANLLVNIRQEIPEIVLDIKYATKDNFIHESVYKQPLAFARKPVVEALADIQAELKILGLGLKIWDAYRPYSVTVKFYEKTHDSVYCAVPWKGSRHNRGCAVDLTLIDLKTGKEVAMPTAYDDFTDKAHPDFMNLPENILKNREFLVSLMKRYGFTPYPSEWWHYDYQGWEKFDLMDIPFEQLHIK
ncbi:MAG: M15 family metallopeptidase [Bacteroidetes bacterium]|nr:M15 family metallopeptidase [Bacteroidota bacterium]